jgi:activator of 2-hydroxyglutaryl-CoA dehydratase
MITKGQFMRFLIDAGVENITIVKYDDNFLELLAVYGFVNNGDLKESLKRINIWEELIAESSYSYVCGKLARVFVDKIGCGVEVSAAAAFWSFAKQQAEEFGKVLGVADLSATGYMVVAVQADGKLLNDTLLTNPRCGAGSGTNLSRIMQKLDIKRDEVDEVLAEYLGEAGKKKREVVSVRADRCGVFSSSATISDKNQGIPLSFALATTIKSEVLKVCCRMPKNLPRVILTGGVFAWQYAQDCARDYFVENGCRLVDYQDKRVDNPMIKGLHFLVTRVGETEFKKTPEILLSQLKKIPEYPSFLQVKKELTEAGGFVRSTPSTGNVNLKKGAEVSIGLDIGSTMAKAVLVDALNGQIISLDSFDNHGDAINTVKAVFQYYIDKGWSILQINSLGITGSGRYQVQKVLNEVYPELFGRVSVLVENYAHARGSLSFAKQAIANLKKEGRQVNEDFFTLVDVGGEDTKISVVSLAENDLYDNAMNIKCSAGTGSLMDTLRVMFGINDIGTAAKEALRAERAYGINATCAVFLMENARRLQADGYDRGEILASCYWAIVENMARTLWPQIKFPEKSIVLLHGQTMLSDPLPLATIHRLRDFIGGEAYGLIPDHPGHRACLGLLSAKQLKGSVKIDLNSFIEKQYERRVFVCRGAVCGDKGASCARSMLLYQDGEGKNKHVLLGGCSAINNLEGQKQNEATVKRKDDYLLINKQSDSLMMESDSERRLVIPRSFAVSDQALFLGSFFSHLGLPVHIDKVVTADILRAQAGFNIDTCAPVIGAAGQYSRLAGEKHGAILALQIDYLPTGGKSLGKTCTTNQGGVVIAMEKAKADHPSSSFYLANLNLSTLSEEGLLKQFRAEFAGLFKIYKLSPTEAELAEALKVALQKQAVRRDSLIEAAAVVLEAAVMDGTQVVVACGREYILKSGCV